MADGPPIWAEHQLSALGDTRLPAAARVLLLAMMLGDPDGMEWRRDDIRELLSSGDPSSDDTIRRMLRSLETTGWVERTPGGKGHGDTFRVLGLQECGSNAGIRVGMGAALKDRVGMGAALNGFRAAGVPTLSAPVVVEEEEEVVGEEEDAREVAGYSLVPSVESIVDQPGDDGRPLLEGCRGALLDYLRARVMGPGQVGYVRSLQAWLRGGSGTPRGLLDVDDPPHLLATALNDLLTEDERKYKSGRGQVGVIANLRTKVEVLAAAEMRPARATGTDGPIHRSRQRREVRVGE